MKILRRPMFSKGGSTNSGIMHGLERRGYAESNWEDLAKAYNISGSDRFSGESDLYKNIDPNLINTGEGGYGTNWFKWLHDRGPDEPSTLIQSIFEEAAEARKYPDLSKTKWEEGPPDGTQLPYVLKKKEDRDNELEKIIAKNESLDDKTKNYLKMMAPHMQKRMIADALGAASEAFGKGTGNTGQTIANAISAAAAGMGGSRDIYDKVKMLTLQGEIMKDVEAAKPKKLGNYEFLAKLSKEDPDTFDKVMKSGDSVTKMAIDFAGNYQSNRAARGLGDAYQLVASSANAKDYGGTLPLTPDGKTADFEKMVKGQIYYNYLDLNFYAIGDDGTPTQVAKPDYLK